MNASAALTSPVCRSAVVLVCLRFPGAIGPGIITEGWRITKLRFGDTGPIAAKRGVIFERRPRDRIMAMCQPQEPAEAHNCVSYATGNFLDQQVIYLTDRFLT